MISGSASLPREGLLCQWVAGVQDQRLALRLGVVDLAGEIRARGRVEHVDPPVTGTWRADRGDGHRVALLVGDPELEAVVLEERDLGNGARIVVHPATGRQRARMRRARQRDAGVADRVGPLGDAGRVGDRGVEQLLYAKLLCGTGKGRVDTLAVLPDHVHLGWVRTEL